MSHFLPGADRMGDIFAAMGFAGSMLALMAAAVIAGCNSQAQGVAPLPPEVTVVEIKPGSATVYDEYVGQTQAPDTIEIRSQVT